MRRVVIALVGLVLVALPSDAMTVKAEAEGDGIVVCCDSGEGKAIYTLKWEHSEPEAVRIGTPFVHKRYRRLSCGAGSERVFDQAPGGSTSGTLSMNANSSTLIQTEILNCPFGTVGFSYIFVPALGALAQETDSDSTFCIQPCEGGFCFGAPESQEGDSD